MVYKVVNTVELSYNKPEIPGQIVCYKQEFVISEQFPMRYCSTWLRSLLCYIKKLVIEEFVIRVLHCICVGLERCRLRQVLLYKDMYVLPYTPVRTYIQRSK